MIPSVGFSDDDIGRIWQRETYMVDDHSNYRGLHHDWIPMQSTGQIDQNGKEVFEGYIIKYKEIFDSPEEIHKSEVCWDEDICGFSPFCDYDSDCGAEVDKRTVEVVGNIYEHPDLLDKKI